MAIANKNNETPLDKAKPFLSNMLRGEPIYNNGMFKDLQGGHDTGKTGNLVLTFSRQGKQGILL